MKKHNLFKVIVLTFLAIVVLTWIIPAGGYGTGEYVSNGRIPLGLFDLVRTPLIAFANLMQYAYVLLVIGGLYGVLSKTGAYAPLVEKWANKIKGKKFLVVMIAIIAILESVTGATFAIFLIIPFLASLVLKKGYGKLTAMASTIGALLLGDMAATYNYNILGYMSEYLGVSLTTNLIPSCILLVLSIIIYSVIVVKTAKVQMIEIEEEIEVEEKVPVKKSTRSSKTASETKTSKSKTAAETKSSKTKTVKTTKAKKEEQEFKIEKKIIKKIRKEVAPVEIPFIDESVSKKGTLALTIFMIIVFVFTVVAMFNWSSVFGIDFFNNLYTKITSIEIAKYPLFKNILGTFSPMGTWSNYDLVIFVVLVTFVIGFIYNVKLDDMLDGYAKGARRMAKPAFYVVLATIIYASMFSTSTGDNIYYTLIHKLLGSKEKVNLLASGVLSGFGSLLYSDFQSLIGTIAAPYALVFTKFMNVAAFILQSIYGLVSFVSPAGIVTVLGLSYFDVSYKEWFKYIWKFLVGVVIITGIIVAVLVFA